MGMMNSPPCERLPRFLEQREREALVPIPFLILAKGCLTAQGTICRRMSSVPKIQRNTGFCRQGGKNGTDT
ncbi:hypothetical protein, partial [Anoxybacillus sp. LAT27]|uniref:hypothetical protein n=1 Tax=Anoxybacillus sp. LAT27 TaxID=2878409 RepID=UPI001EDC224D